MFRLNGRPLTHSIPAPSAIWTYWELPLTTRPVHFDYWRLHYKHIKPGKISKKQVRKHPFPGKTAEEITQKLSEISCKSGPGRIILHAGTNNIPGNPVDACVSKITKLAQSTRQKFPDSKIEKIGI